MQSLIETDSASFDEHPPGATLTFLPVIEPKPPERDNHLPEPPLDPATPPPRPPRVMDPGPEVATGYSEVAPPAADDPTGPIGEVSWTAMSCRW